MKKILLAISLLSAVSVGAQVMTVTNLTTSQVLVISNNQVISTLTYIPTVPQEKLVGTNGVVVPQALIDYEAQQLGIPASILQEVPLKDLLLLGLLIVGVPIVSQYLLKLIPALRGSFVEHTALNTVPSTSLKEEPPASLPSKSSITPTGISTGAP